MMSIQSQVVQYSLGPRTTQPQEFPVHAITKDDAIQEAYARFVFRNLLIQYHQVSSVLYTRNFTIFASYYVSSYRGTNRCADPYKWCHALWDIRQRYGQEFADKLLFYTFQQWQPARRVKATLTHIS